MMFKFNIGDWVVCVGFEESGPLRINNRSAGDCFKWYYTDDGSVHQESNCTLYVAPVDPLEIKTLYEVEGVYFDILEDAQDHQKKVRIFNLLSENLDSEASDVLLELLEPILKNAKKLKEILN